MNDPFSSPAAGFPAAFSPVVAPPGLAGPVERWGVFEVELAGPVDGNPFLDVRLTAVFTHGEVAREVEGFYDGDGVYRVRFMPDREGEWRYETRSNRWPLTGQRGGFRCVAPSAGNHGPVRVAHGFHFAHADGTPYRQLGTTCYSWTHHDDAQAALTLRTLAGAPFNKLRMCLTPQNPPSSRPTGPDAFPFAGTPPRGWDFTRFHPGFFRRQERLIARLGALGIQADVIFFHPYGKDWGFDTMAPDVDDRYLRYAAARLAAFRHVWWSVANEYDFLRTKTEADWDRFFHVIAAADPYGRLRSIHNGYLIYNHTHPWVTHASIQNGAAVEDPGRAQMYRDVWRKPVVYDEVKYEGRVAPRWGQLDGREMVHRFWCGTVAGTYVGHSEALPGPDGGFWLGYGGGLRGESPPRLAFLRQVLEDAPAAGIEPIDKWQDVRTGGQPGEYYLVYFGHEAPARWPFRLFKNALSDGMRFRVEIIDTWAMTVTPVPGEFTVARLDNYHFVDRDGRAVELPGRPGLALRIRYAGGGQPTTASDAPPTE